LRIEYVRSATELLATDAGQRPIVARGHHDQRSVQTVNFSFLGADEARLVQLGALAERYFRDDPSTCLFKLRQFAELVAKLVAAHHALYVDDRQTFEETLRRLGFERVIPREAADLFHQLRKLGNAAAHEVRGSHAEALTGLKLARQLGIWFHRTYGKQPGFKPGVFTPPPKPVDATGRSRPRLKHCNCSTSGSSACGRTWASPHN
jgi:type I restriction enzyme R subunit